MPVDLDYFCISLVRIGLKERFYLPIFIYDFYAVLNGVLHNYNWTSIIGVISTPCVKSGSPIYSIAWK